MGGLSVLLIIAIISSWALSQPHFNKLKQYNVVNVSISTNNDLGVGVFTNHSSNIYIMDYKNYINASKNLKYSSVCTSNFSTFGFLDCKNVSYGGTFYLFTPNTSGFHYEFFEFKKGQELSNNKNLNEMYFNLQNLSIVTLYAISDNQQAPFLNHTYLCNRGTWKLPFIPNRDDWFLVSSPQVINPYTNYNASPFGHNPIGIAAYGIDTGHDKNVTWQINTNEILGIMNASEMVVAEPFTDYPGIMSLQLNVLLSGTSKGVQKTYWLQNVADISTVYHKMKFQINIQNFSTITLLKENPLFASYNEILNYSLPLNLSLMIKNVNYKNGSKGTLPVSSR